MTEDYCESVNAVRALDLEHLMPTISANALQPEENATLRHLVTTHRCRQLTTLGDLIHFLLTLTDGNQQSVLKSLPLPHIVSRDQSRASPTSKFCRGDFNTVAVGISSNWTLYRNQLDKA